MAQPKNAPRAMLNWDPAALMPLMGPMALPFLLSHSWFTATAQMSQFWVDLLFEPHHVDGAKGHELPVPDTLDEGQPNIDLFA